MKLTLIAEGSTKWQRFIRRWGVSFLIGEDVLFDTFGDPDMLLHNMQRFKVNAARIGHIVLSHDDWDHIAGLWSVIKNRKDITVYICPGFKQKAKDAIASSGVKLVTVKNGTLIKEGIYSTGELSGDSDGRKVCEQSLAIKTANGLTVICGCAHPGAVNIVRHVKEYFHKDVDFLMGGFHMKDNTDGTNLNIINDLRSLDVRRVAPTHCTGKRATDAMREVFRDGFIKIKAGDDLEV